MVQISINNEVEQLKKQIDQLEKKLLFVQQNCQHIIVESSHSSVRRCIKCFYYQEAEAAPKVF
ncbi:hypothetical protein GFV16_19000 [Bacillus megaterium]|uniref:hypothetical protein n=1 Tax=Priestia megaterium TaxID=1404 RepID=UPI00132085C0|nr:hypothetical protein [Priestia megaterium]MQR87983.1 hypothetical protein [Priestia megaterium]